MCFFVAKTQSGNFKPLPCDGDGFLRFDCWRNVCCRFAVKEAPLPDFKIDQCPQAFGVVFARLMARD